MSIPAMTYELAMMKVDERSHIQNHEGIGHLPREGAGSIRVLVGGYLMAIGRWIAGAPSVAPAAGSH